MLIRHPVHYVDIGINGLHPLSYAYHSIVSFNIIILPSSVQSFPALNFGKNYVYMYVHISENLFKYFYL